MMDWWQWLLGPCIGIALGILGWHVVGPMLERLCRRVRSKVSSGQPRYAATYQTTITGGSLPANGDPRDQGVLDLAKWIARRHWDLIRLEFNGEPIWTREAGWIGGDDNGTT